MPTDPPKIWWKAACDCRNNCHGYRRYNTETEARKAWERHGGTLSSYTTATTITVLEDTPRKAQTNGR